MLFSDLCGKNKILVGPFIHLLPSLCCVTGHQPGLTTYNLFFRDINKLQVNGFLCVCVKHF